MQARREAEARAAQLLSAEQQAQLQLMETPVPQAGRAEMAAAPRPPAAAKILGHNECLEWQIRMARHLAFTHQRGPFEIGDFVCNIEGGSGTIKKLAMRCEDENGEKVWVSMTEKDVLKMQTDEREERSGRPIWRRDGAFHGFGESPLSLDPAPTFLPRADRDANRRKENIMPEPRWDYDPFIGCLNSDYEDDDDN
ncbi:hypothetical protein ESCO_006637 [Escovopsis weberi]|uniref:Uncharacterized protein n=1 Tax=Escovopsis weberi TaxID=150374 RepID=A0A0M9VXR4_ESCWE|nr:hypothetical protein ESCO_006637 [Escovopsis weberi]